MGTVVILMNPINFGLRLTKQDREILKHVQRHRMTTINVLHQLFFPDKSIAALKSTLRRLCGREPECRFLASAPLAGKRVYYYLTANGARFLGTSPDDSGPLGPQARYHRFAVLSFIHGAGDGKRTLFDPTRFQDVFPLRGHRLNRNDFFIDESGEMPKLGVLIVDHGARPRRIVAKTLQRLGRFFRNRWFDEFIRDRNFNVTILTLSEGKKAMLLPFLRQAVRLCLARPNRDGLDQRIQSVEFSVVVVPTLQELLPGSW